MGDTNSLMINYISGFLEKSDSPTQGGLASHSFNMHGFQVPQLSKIAPVLLTKGSTSVTTVIN